MATSAERAKEIRRTKGEAAAQAFLKAEAEAQQSAVNLRSPEASFRGTIDRSAQQPLDPLGAFRGPVDAVRNFFTNTSDKSTGPVINPVTLRLTTREALRGPLTPLAPIGAQPTPVGAQSTPVDATAPTNVPPTPNLRAPDGSVILDPSTVDTSRFNADGTANNGIGPLGGGRQVTQIGPNDVLRQQGGVSGPRSATQPNDLFTIRRQGPLAGLPQGSVTNETLGVLADQKRAKLFAGGAAGGAGLLRQVNAINRRAQQAFENARKQGLTTQSAERAANNIREQANDLLELDRNTVGREGIAADERITAATNASRLQEAGLREAGALTEAGRRAQQETFGKSRDELYDGFFPQYDEETKKYIGVDQGAKAQAMRRAGGREVLDQLDASTAGAMLERGINASQILKNVNRRLGGNVRLESYADLLRGASVTKNGKLEQSEATLMDVLRGDISITSLYGEKIQLGNGMMIDVKDFFEGATLSQEERNALIESKAK